MRENFDATYASLDMSISIDLSPNRAFQFATKTFSSTRVAFLSGALVDATAVGGVAFMADKASPYDTYGDG